MKIETKSYEIKIRRKDSMKFHELAMRIAKKEKGKTQVNIAQIKEVLKITLTELAKDPYETIKLLARYK